MLTYQKRRGSTGFPDIFEAPICKSQRAEKSAAPVYPMSLPESNEIPQKCPSGMLKKKTTSAYNIEKKFIFKGFKTKESCAQSSDAITSASGRTF
jgi:hypothetical protein